MRIIAGEFRGRTLLAPESRTTRPVTDRVKQSLFDIIAGDLPDAVVYDCFAGTGSMGLESLSRGARLALFMEADRSALGQLRKNIAALKVGDRSTVVPGDLFKWFAQVRPPADERAKVIFLDPPYRFVVERSAEVRELVAHMLEHHLTEDGYIVFRHDAGDNLQFTGVQEIDRREYGGMVLRFLGRQPSA
jgi:16S rRNA (guanine966-N2)-methyltransferase